MTESSIFIVQWKQTDKLEEFADLWVSYPMITKIEEFAGILSKLNLSIPCNTCIKKKEDEEDLT
jgi:hypothetical protein